MNKITALATVILLFIFLIKINAQFSLDTVDYNSFVSYNVNFKSLGIIASTNYENQFENTYNSKFFNFGANSNLNYYGLKNLEDKQTFATTNGAIFYTNNSKEKPRINSNISFTSNTRLYKNKKSKTFTELNPRVVCYYNHTSEPVIKDYVNLFSALELRGGIGRINPIDEVFTTAFILDDLQKAGLDISFISQDKLFELSKILVGIRNKRILDNRRSRVQQFLEVNKFLNTITPTSEDEKAIVSAVIFDNIFFTSITGRNSGHRWSLGTEPYFNYGGTSNNSLKIIGTNLNFKYDYSKAISRFFHLDVNGSIGGIIEKNFKLPIEYRKALNAGIYIGYYPSTRTSIKSGIQGQNIGGKYAIYSSTNINYFINYYTRFDFDFNATLLSNNYLNGNFAIQHALF